MTVLMEEQVYAPDDLMSLRGLEHCELVDGRLVEKNLGAEADWIGLHLGMLLSSHVFSNNLGWAFSSEAGYVCVGVTGVRVRRPDLSFVSRARLSRPPRGFIQVAPDLAVEVVAPNDLFSEVQAKIEEYLRAGVQLVWVIDPDTRTVVEYHLSGKVRLLHESDELNGGDVLPAFHCAVKDLFLPMEPADASEE